MTEEKKDDRISITIPVFRKGQLVIVAILIVISFALGSFWTKMQYLDKVGTQVQEATTTTTQDTAQQPPQAAPTEDLSPKKVSIDDDPMLGDANAPVTLIEFSDYECPFCKRHFDDTYTQLKKEYIDTGKVKLVYRDLPLNFHQNAHKEAQAAECAREQGGDSVYFKFHDEIFKRTTSNGTGLALDQLPIIATDLGLNGDALQSCLDSEKYKAEVDKDLADASKAGANATPSFFIGKSASDGIIEGTPLTGAQPFSAFKAEIDKKLQ